MTWPDDEPHGAARRRPGILLVEPEVIEIRRTEADITAARAAALPAALGTVLDLIAGVLRELPGTAVDNAPRMADFAKVLAALDAVTGWDTLACYRAKVAGLALSLIEGNTFAYAIYWLATCPSPGGLDPAPWEGTAELLGTLRRICADARMPASDLPEDVRAVGRQVREMLALSDPAWLALELAALGWHILPLSAASKRPLGNCPACRAQHGSPAHRAPACPCLPDSRWCHDVRTATTDPGRITTWWRREPAAAPGVAAGPLAWS